jgi:hypothetical protein
MVQILVDKKNEITEGVVQKYSAEISQWLDVPRAVLKKYSDESQPTVLRDEALLALDNLQDALDYLMDNFIDKEKLLKHIRQR